MGGAEQGTDKIGSRGAINVFISNAIEDNASAQDLYGALKKPGIEPWVDNRPPLEGELFVDAIEEESKGTDCLIALLSRHSVDPAGHVQKEWRLARDTEGITFIAIRVEEHSPPEEFADMHWMDLFPSDKEAYKEGLRKLLRLLYRIKRVAWFEESFSSFGPDNEGWELGEWELVSDDNTGIGSESINAKASLSPSKLLPQIVTKTASVSLELGDSKALEYARKLDLSVYLGNAAFQVIIDDGAAHVIDEEAHTQDYKENKWTRRKLPLARYATERVTLKFVLSITGKMNYMAHAAAWVDVIRILGEADIETVVKRSFFTPRDSGKYLKLVAEAKLANLLENVKNEKTLEASGVVVREKDILIVMDWVKGIGRLEGQNVKDPLGKGKIVGSQRVNHGYEAITRVPKTGHLFLMTEALEHGVKIQAKLAELDADLGSIGEEWLDFNLPSETRGFAGAAVVCHNGNMLLLALCEGNSCAAGDLGKQKGNGLIQVFEKKKNSWGHIGRIKLPQKANFEDYADIAVRGKQVAIVSQAESALWVGTIALSSLKISGNGRVYRFPLDKNDKCVYCNVEGVDWLADDRVIVVSDRMKTDQPGRCAKKDKSIHIMDIPG